MKLLAFHLLFFASLSHAQEKPRAAAPKDVQWEYSTAVVYDANGENERLAKFGAEGWELVSVVYVDKVPKAAAVPTNANLQMHLRYYFKRPKSK